MAHENPLETSQHEELADRHAADALVRDYRTAGSVVIKRRGRILRTGLFVGVSLLVVYFVATFAQVVQTGRERTAAPADAIIVMGAAQYDGRPSPQLAARLDHVVELYESGVAPLIVVTGGKIPGDRFTEAAASVRYLAEHGVPEAAIVEVGEGSTTFESVEAAAPEMAALGVETVALVTDPFHSLRSRLIVEGEGFEVDVAATGSSVVTGWAEFRRNLIETAGVALGRLIGFETLSDLTG